MQCVAYIYQFFLLTFYFHELVFDKNLKGIYVPNIFTVGEYTGQRTLSYHCPLGWVMAGQSNTVECYSSRENQGFGFGGKEQYFLNFYTFRIF